LTLDGFKVGDACGQVGSMGSFDFGAELQAEALLEFVALGAQRLDLIARDGDVGAKAGRCRSAAKAACIASRVIASGAKCTTRSGAPASCVAIATKSCR